MGVSDSFTELRLVLAGTDVLKMLGEVVIEDCIVMTRSQRKHRKKK